MTSYVFAALSLLLCLPLSAKVLDGFTNATRTGWTDTTNGGSFATSVDAFTINTATADGSLTYSRKTSDNFTNVLTHTLEFTVDVKSVSPASPDTNALAILAWVPTGGAVLANGYSLSVGANDVRIGKDATVLYSANVALQNSDITMVLRMTPSGATVSVTARIYKRSGGTASLLFEYTVVDGAGIIGTAGNAALGVQNQASPSGSSAIFDELKVFDIINGVLDNFNRANSPNNLGSPAWAPLGGGLSIIDNQARVKTATNGVLTGAAYVGKSFKIEDGGRVEFSLDVVSNGNGDNAYSVLAYLPSLTAEYLASLRSYHIASLSGPYDDTLFAGKEYNRWWASLDDASIDFPTANYRLIQAFSAEGTSIRIENRLEDLNVDVNDPLRVRFQNVFVDTPGPDGTGPNGDTFNGGAAYLNFSGLFTMLSFNAGNPLGADVTYDNALFGATITGNSAPFFFDVFPPDGTNFLAPTSVVSFTVFDDLNIPANNIVLTLNGIRYTNGSPGVAITQPGPFPTQRIFKLTGGLTANVNYIGTIQATDNQGLSAIPFKLRFDTFLTNTVPNGGVYVVESEEYNFGDGGPACSSPGTFGGSFIDNPLLIPEGGVNQSFAYNGQVGTAEIDYHDNRGTCGPGYDEDHTFRTEDAVRTSQTEDGPRSKYTNPGGVALGFFEEIVQDIQNGDWVNYTHTYPAGTYNVILRQSLFQLDLPQALVTLERVLDVFGTSDPTTTMQTTTALGAFLQTETGFGVYRNTPLTDGIGNPVVIRFSGAQDTVRVMNRITGNSDDNVGILTQNYLVFAPTVAAPPGSLRPIVSVVSPLPGSTLKSVFPVTTASIANRDTSVIVGSIVLQINGSPVLATVTPTDTGADVSYALSPLPPPDSMITNTLTFSDSDLVVQTNTWTWTLTYPFLRASNSLPVGSLSARGFDARMVQADGPELGNSLLRAEQQLAIPPVIPYTLSATSVVQTLDWNESGSPNPVPGLAPGDYVNIAVESLAYLELTAGVHRFHIVTDDMAQLRSGATLKGPGAVVLFESPSGTFNGTFDFVAEATGLYPLRAIWEENGGSAVLSISSVDLGDNSETLVNDPADPAGVVRAWYPIWLVSSATVTGPYTLDTTASFNTGTQTITVPAPGSTRFYQVVGPRSLRITSTSVAGPNIVMTYQAE